MPLKAQVQSPDYEHIEDSLEFLIKFELNKKNTRHNLPFCFRLETVLDAFHLLSLLVLEN